jgi:hypothetical protein
MSIVKKIWWLGGESFSPDAQAVFDIMPNAINSPVKNAMATFIDSQVTAGNWAKVLDFVYLGLNTSNNSYKGWKNQITCTPVGGVYWFKYDGLYSTGASGAYVRTGIIPSTLTGASLNNFGIGAYIKEMRSTSRPLFGVLEAASSGRQVLLSETTGSFIRYLINGVTSETDATDLGFQDYNSYTADRTGAASMRLIKNATVLETDTEASSGLATIEIDMFGRNNDGVHELPAEGRARCYWVINAVGFDYTAWNNGINTLNAAIDALITFVPFVDMKGQSNSVGRAEINRLADATIINPNGYLASPEGMMLYYKTTYDITDNGKWVRYLGGTNSVEPVNESSINCFGMEIALASKLYQRLGFPTRFVKTGVGATSLNPNASPDWYPTSTGELFDQSTTAYVNPSLTKIGTEYSGKTIKPILHWHQGEQDATNGTFTANYTTNFPILVTAWRATQAIYATAPLFITLLNYAQSANENTINEDFISYANANDNVYLIAAFTDPAAYLAARSVHPTAGKCINVTVTYPRKSELPGGIKSTYPPTASDDTHNSGEFQNLVGEAIFDKLVELSYI